MSAVSIYLRSEVVEYFLRGDIPLYLALFEGNPLADFSGNGEETSFTGYERQLITFTAYDSLTDVVSNAENVVFPASNQSTEVEITYAGVMDSQDNLFLFGSLNKMQAIGQGDVLIIPANELRLRVI